MSSNQAVCKDRIFPKIHVFAKGYGASENPRRAYILAYVIGVAFICIGKGLSFNMFINKGYWQIHLDNTMTDLWYVRFFRNRIQYMYNIIYKSWWDYTYRFWGLIELILNWHSTLICYCIFFIYKIISPEHLIVVTGN